MWYALWLIVLGTSTAAALCSLRPLLPCTLPLSFFLLQEHGGDVSAGYAEMGSEGGSKGGEARKEQLAEVSTLQSS
jgi:hypothetical protein